MTTTEPEQSTPNLAEYGDFGGDEAEAGLGELKALSGGNFMDLDVGENWFRILPRKKPLKAYVLISTHFVDRPGDEHTIAFVCPRKHANRAPCPMCETADEAFRLATSRNDEKAIKQAKRLYPRTRAYYNVIDRDDEEAGPKVLRMPWGVHTDLLTMIKRKRVSLSNPMEGYDCLIDRVGTGKKNTKYTFDIDDGPTELGKLAWLEIADQDLERFIAVDSLESIQARLRGDTLEEGAQALPPAASQAAVGSGSAPVVDATVVEEPKKSRRQRSQRSKQPEVDTDDDIPF